MQPDLHVLAKDFTDGKLTPEEFLYRRAKIICSIAANDSGADANNKEISAIEEYESKHLIPKLAEENRLSEEKARRNYRWSRNGLIGATSVFAFIVVVYFLVGNEQPPQNLQLSGPATQTPNEPQPIQTETLESQIQNLVTIEHWDTDQLMHFLHLWNSTTIKERQNTVKTDLFAKFKEGLFERVYGEHQYDTIELQLLSALAEEISHYTSPPAKRTASAKSPGKIHDSSRTIPQSSKTADRISGQKLSIMDVANKPQKTPSTTITGPKRGITDNDLVYLISQYQKAFEDGDVDKLAVLLDDKDMGNSQSDNFPNNKFPNNKTQTLKKFSELIGSTSNRNISFSSWNWENQGTSASGSSQVKVTMKNDITGKTENLSADVLVTVAKRFDDVVISKMRWDNIVYHSETSDEIPDRTASSGSASEKPVAPTELPSDSELKTLISQFIDAYEIGDATAFSDLFTENALTNGQHSRAGILGEYSELFQQTAERKMYVRDLDWSFRNYKAVGKARLEVHVRPKSENNTRKFVGKVEFVTEKHQNKIQFSRLYHSLR